jgi:hypothetical protein
MFGVGGHDRSSLRVRPGRYLHKLALRDRVQLVVTAYESGLAQPGA